MPCAHHDIHAASLATPWQICGLLQHVARQRHAQVMETLLAWCDAQMRGYGGSVQAEREELAAPTTPFLRAQVLAPLPACPALCIGLAPLRGTCAHFHVIVHGCAFLVGP